MHDFVTPGTAAANVPRHVIVEGGQSRPRGMATFEMLWVDFNVLEPEAIPYDIEARGLNPRYAALEIASLLSGQPVDSHQRLSAKGMAAYQDYGIQRGNYGVRLRNQLRDFVDKLGIEDPYSRQAVMTIYDGTRDLNDESSDVPCTLAVQGFVREGNFYMKTMMRSNDAYLGLPYDLMQFCALQTTLCEVLLTLPGFYRHSVGSLHVYANDIEKIDRLGDAITMNRKGETMWAIPDHFDDPRDRLKYVTMFCQDALFGQTQPPQTSWEEWLVNSL